MSMKELEYPFDAGRILANRRKIRKELLSGSDSFAEKRIAVLGGSTTSGIVQALELFLLNQGIRPSFYESAYGKYYEDACFGSEALDAFRPDIIYIHTTNRNVTAYPALTDTEEDIRALLDAEAGRFTEIWESLARRYGCPVIQNNFEMPLYRLLGNLDAADIHGRVNFLSRLNEAFYAYAREHRNFYICDINYISADYGLKEWSDPFYWHMYKYALNVSAIPYLSFNVARIIKSLFGKNKKGLVLDLDNTLWGGVIGDDGPEHISIGHETSQGQVFTEFQEYLKEQKQLGVLLNIDSKNDEENALAGLKHPESTLAPEDFIEIRANWDPKDRNFREIAESLNLLPESLVFIADTPAERHIIREQLPGVSAPEIGESHQYIVNIDRNGYFEATTLSADDLKRNEMYRENAQRAKLQAGFADYGEYLDSLEMKAVIRPFEPMYLERIAQLTNKTNQFNLTTRRFTQGEIEAMAEDPGYITLYGKLEDRFGDNGVVSVAAGHQDGGILHMDLWLMSCRVLKRDMEYAMMDELVRRCRQAGVTEIRGYYFPTAKNAMVKDFYGTLGFTKIREDEKGSAWSLAVTGAYENKNRHIKTEDAQ